jgi:hypothetical protein
MRCVFCGQGLVLLFSDLLVSRAYIKPQAMMSMWDEDTPATARGITCMSVLPLPS